MFAHAVDDFDHADQMTTVHDIRRQPELDNAGIFERGDIGATRSVNQQRAAMVKASRAILHVLAEHDGARPGLTGLTKQ